MQWKPVGSKMTLNPIEFHCMNNKTDIVFKILYFLEFEVKFYLFKVFSYCLCVMKTRPEVSEETMKSCLNSLKLPGCIQTDLRTEAVLGIVDIYHEY